MRIHDIRTDRDLREYFAERGEDVYDHSEEVVEETLEISWYVTELPDGSWAEWNEYPDQDYCEIHCSRGAAVEASFQGYIDSSPGVGLWVGPEIPEYVEWLESLSDEEYDAYERSCDERRDRLTIPGGLTIPGADRRLE